MLECVVEMCDVCDGWDVDACEEPVIVKIGARQQASEDPVVDGLVVGVRIYADVYKGAEGAKGGCAGAWDDIVVM